MFAAARLGSSIKVPGSSDTGTSVGNDHNESALSASEV
jgi:hypothetical protein